MRLKSVGGFEQRTAVQVQDAAAKYHVYVNGIGQNKILSLLLEFYRYYDRHNWSQ